VALTAAFHIWKGCREDPEGLSNSRQAVGENLDLLTQLDELLNSIKSEMER